MGAFDPQDFHSVQTDTTEKFRDSFGRPLDFNRIETRSGYARDSREIDQILDRRIEPTIDGIEDFSGGRHGRAE
jgi:hypothetical protein